MFNLAELLRQHEGKTLEYKRDLSSSDKMSVIEPASVKESVAEGVRRIEDIASGRVQGLTQDQYRAALG